MIAAREANMTRDTIDRADQARLGQRRRRQLRRGPLRGLRSGRRGADRRGADQQPQPHGRRGPLELQPSTAAISARPTACPSCSTGMGEFRFPLEAGTADEVLEKAIDAGADDVVSGEGEEGVHEIYCAQENFNAVREALEKSLGQPSSRQADVAAQDHRAGRGRDGRRRCSTSSPRSKTTTTSRTSTPISRCRTTLWRSSRPEAGRR